jgi:uncharacterized protein with GYD domain
LGQVDQGQASEASVVDAPDKETVAAFLLKLGGTGSLRTKTMRAFTDEEMTSLIGTLAD